MLSTILVSAFLLVPTADPTPLPGLSVSEAGVLLRGGRPYHGIGVNYFNCFLRTLADGADVSYDDGFRILATYRIPFVRFSATGFWPRDMKLYQTDREAYFRRLDGVVRSAEKHGVGLIPSLFWYYGCVPDLVGEPMSAWGDPKSRTHAFLRDYTRQVVGRYHRSPAVWAWEFGNEHNLACDLPNAAQHRPKVVKQLGTALTRSQKDDLTHDMLATALVAFGAEVRRIDRHRPICSGDAIPRPSAWHNRQERTWTKDRPEQFAAMLRLTAPAPVDLVSVHCYGDSLGRIPEAAAVARQLGKPLFVGEFQVADLDRPEARDAFRKVLNTLGAAHVPLAAMWVFDYPPQSDRYSVTATNDRGWQLELIRDWNRHNGGAPPR